MRGYEGFIYARKEGNPCQRHEQMMCESVVHYLFEDIMP